MLHLPAELAGCAKEFAPRKRRRRLFDWLRTHAGCPRDRKIHWVPQIGTKYSPELTEYLWSLLERDEKLPSCTISRGSLDPTWVKLYDSRPGEPDVLGECLGDLIFDTEITRAEEKTNYPNEFDGTPCRIIFIPEGEPLRYVQHHGYRHKKYEDKKVTGIIEYDMLRRLVRSLMMTDPDFLAEVMALRPYGEDAPNFGFDYLWYKSQYAAHRRQVPFCLRRFSVFVSEHSIVNLPLTCLARQEFVKRRGTTARAAAEKAAVALFTDFLRKLDAEQSPE